ncbi:MAG: undecaprenyl/decaprenyl-phosphate alpha-N-acetylglucosaminyl 1-phosphate transferase [Cytophagales bacterium]|nr:MAG: undecaprenyl/decaprenyl-phosphate alpha-N-acetylglucosaminyl 1-phosphate transferase [Cytophagales bacterium]
MINSVLCFLWAFLISVFAIPSIINVAHLKQLLDEPNYRTIHRSLTPRLGGIAIFAGLVSSITIFGHVNKEVQQVIAGCILLFFIGIKDDLVSVSPFKKFFVQVLATGIVVFIGNIRITSFQGLFGLQTLPDGISYAFTFLVIIGITNAINLIDGIDGLAGSICIYIATIIGFYIYFQIENGVRSYSDLAFCLAGSLIGFLRYNFRNAIIFMGDTGSLVCGFIIAILAVKFIELKPVANSPVVALSMLIIPVIDTLKVFFIRIINGKSPFSPDQNHIHHHLKKLGYPNSGIIVVILTFSLFMYAIAFLTSELEINIALTIQISFVVLTLLLVYFYANKVEKVKI